MWCGDFGSSIVCVHQRGRRRPVAKSTTKQILHAMALTPLSLAPCAVHMLATEPGDEGGMMAKRVVADDACLQEGDTLDCVVGHRRRQRETNPGRLEAETAKVPC